MHLLTLTTFLVCFLPGVCLGFAACALMVNRRLHKQTLNTPRPLVRL